MVTTKRVTKEHCQLPFLSDQPDVHTAWCPLQMAHRACVRDCSFCCDPSLHRHLRSLLFRTHEADTRGASDSGEEGAAGGACPCDSALFVLPRL